MCSTAPSRGQSPHLSSGLGASLPVPLSTRDRRISQHLRNSRRAGGPSGSCMRYTAGAQKYELTEYD